MARSNLQRRQDAERARIKDYCDSLRRVSTGAKPAQNFHQAIVEAQQGFDDKVIRNPDAWHPQLKTRDVARLRLAAARYLFARYPVPAPLERIWCDGTAGLSARDVEVRKRWYITVAQGGSLYKAHAKDWLSRKEVHCFLNPPGDLSFEEALWQAVARSYTDDVGLALRIARSKIARLPPRHFAFWREAARFFCVHPAPLEEVDDLCDFLAARRHQDPDYSLKGRTPASVRRQMHAWHRELAQVRRIEEALRRQAQQAALGRRRDRLRRVVQPVAEAGRWSGANLADWSLKLSVKDAHKKEEVMVVQLRTAVDLVAESGAMRHCVSSYAQHCIAGHSSIWSLRRRTGNGLERLLTIELDKQNKAVQIRGFANRLARPEELRILARWAKAKGVTLPE